MAVHLDAGPDSEGRARELIVVVDAAANVVEIATPLTVIPNLPLFGPLDTTVRQYHALKQEARLGNPVVHERRRGDGRWKHRTEGLKVSIGDLIGGRR